MLANGAPECSQINQMICLPFVPRTRTNYQATPDVLKATFYFYSHNTQYVQNKTTIHLASTTTYKIYNIHKLRQSAPPQASGRQDPRGCPLRGWPHAQRRGAARASLREWNIPLPYMGLSTVLNAVTRARRPFRCCFRFSFVSLRSFWIEVSSRLSSSAMSVLSASEHGGGRPAATSSLWTASCLPVLYDRIPISIASWTSGGELYVSLGAMDHTTLWRDSLAFCVRPMEQEASSCGSDSLWKRGFSSWKKSFISQPLLLWWQ